MKLMGRLLLILVSQAVILPAAFGHHSTAANYDESTTIEIEGVITEVRWRNPHVMFKLGVGTAAGVDEIWRISTNSVSGLRRKNISKAILEVGDHVRFAGHPARHDDTGLWATNLLLEGVREFVLDTGAGQRWSGEVNGMSGPVFATEGDVSEPERGIFRVWSHTRATNMLLPETVVADFDVMTYPLTESARQLVREFNPVTDNPTANCAPKGMPTIMEQPYPMGIVEDGSDIILNLEEYDTVRTVHMEAGTAPGETQGSPLGYSVGHWEGNTLVVSTDHMNWGHFDQAGVPLSDAVVVTERFALSDDGGRLDYSMTIVDSATFTEPVELTKFWLYVPGVEVHTFECVAD